jgi:hypothetical protein
VTPFKRHPGPSAGAPRLPRSQALQTSASFACASYSHLLRAPIPPGMRTKILLRSATASQPRHLSFGGNIFWDKNKAVEVDVGSAGSIKAISGLLAARLSPTQRWRNFLLMVSETASAMGSTM